jgi:hypothetical protein
VHLVKSLSKGVPDLGAVGSEGYKFVTACKTACVAFDKLMILNPNSVLTKRVYARFLMEVRCAAHAHMATRGGTVHGRLVGGWFVRMGGGGPMS